jgi:hypothetical protein
MSIEDFDEACHAFYLGIIQYMENRIVGAKASMLGDLMGFGLIEL